MRLLTEPTLHFFAIGLLLFAVHAKLTDDPRTVVVTPRLKSELARIFRDQNERPPSPAELDAVIAAWKREEVLYREALREGLEQQDSTVRSVLADTLRTRLRLELPKREPTDQELDAWLDAHETLYETPRRYEFEFLSFEKAEASSDAELQRVERELAAGARAASLGRPVYGATLNSLELEEKFGRVAAKRIPALPLSTWQRLERDSELWLVRVKRVEGGLPSRAQIRPRLVADWTYATEKRAVELATQALVDRYRFEEEE